jgi:serine/threonine-protein kinase
MDDIILIHREIAEQVARELRAVLTLDDRARISVGPTPSLLAYNAYLMGRYEQNHRTGEGLRRSIGHFNQAIEQDSTFADAYAGLADSYTLLANYGLLQQSEAFPVCRSAAQRALELDSLSAEAFTSLAWVKYSYDWDWEGAERDFLRALELSPDYPRAHQWYAHLLATLGRFDEAEFHARASRDLEPLSSSASNALTWILNGQGKTEELFEILTEMVEMEPEVPLRHRDLGITLLNQGFGQAALEEFQLAESLATEGTMYKAWLGFAYGSVGDSTRAHSILQELLRLSELAYVPSMEVAQIYLGLGDRDNAFRWLDRAYEERDDLLLRLGFFPLFDGIRDDPRYTDLVRRMNLPNG